MFVERGLEIRIREAQRRHHADANSADNQDHSDVNSETRQSKGTVSSLGMPDAPSTNNNRTAPYPNARPTTVPAVDRTIDCVTSWRIDTSATSAKCGSHRDLVSLGGALRQRQVGDVDASEQQEQRRCAEHDEENRAQVADDGREQRLQQEFTSDGLRDRLAEFGHRDVAGAEQLRHRHAWAQPDNGVVSVRTIEIGIAAS